MKKPIISYLVLFLFLFLNPFQEAEGSTQLLEIHFIDVGQGDAVLVKGPNKHNILINAGSLSSSYKLITYLKNQNISKFEAIIITHMHQDHVGGLYCLLPKFYVKKIYDNGAYLPENNFWEEYIILIRELDIKREILKEGDRLKFGNLKLNVLSPSTALIGDLNADSIVIKMDYGDVSFFLAGDLIEKREKILVNKDVSIKCQVLKVGHHGACDATSDSFLENINPEIAIISVGKDNKYGYPCFNTVNKIRNRGVKIYRTDINGTVIIKTDGKKINVNYYSKY